MSSVIAGAEDERLTGVAVSLVLAIVNAWRPSLSRLEEVEDFGTNPGALRMLTYLPD